MRRKDYELLARVFRTELWAGDAIQRNHHRGGIVAVANLLAVTLHADNPGFDIERWLKDAGVTS